MTYTLRRFSGARAGEAFMHIGAPLETMRP